MQSFLRLGSSLRPILVPVNFEPASRAALIFAARLAAGTGAPLKILHVVHEPADSPNYYGRNGKSGLLQPIEVLAERLLNQFLTDLYGLNPGLEALETPDVTLVRGLPSNRIPEVALQLDAAQIVMGHAKPTGFFPSIFGALSDRVADNCDIPVTVIHADGKSEVTAIPPQRPFDGDVVLGA